MSITLLQRAVSDSPITPAPMSYGVTKTRYGFEPCIMQEDGHPILTVGHVHKKRRDAFQEALRLTAEGVHA